MSTIDTVIKDVENDLALEPELKERLRGAIERLAFFTARRITAGEIDDENIRNCITQIELIAGQHAQDVKAKLNERIRAFIAFGFDLLLDRLG